jgi:hypothetical protein
MEQFLKQLSTEGLLQSKGSFTLDSSKTLEKLGQASLPRKTAWVTKLLQVAVMEGANSFSLSRKRRSWELEIGDSHLSAHEAARQVLQDEIPSPGSVFHPLQYALRFLITSKLENLAICSGKELAIFKDGKLTLLETETDNSAGPRLILKWNGRAALGNNRELKSELLRSSGFLDLRVRFQGRLLRRKPSQNALYGCVQLQDGVQEDSLNMRRLDPLFGQVGYDATGTRGVGTPDETRPVDAAFVLERCEAGKGGVCCHWSCHGVPLLSEFTSFSSTPLRLDFILPFPLERSDLTGWSFRNEDKKMAVIAALDPVARALVEFGQNPDNLRFFEQSGNTARKERIANFSRRAWLVVKLSALTLLLSGLTVGTLYQIAAALSGRGYLFIFLLAIFVLLSPLIFLTCMLYLFDLSDRLFDERVFEQERVDDSRIYLARRQWMKLE